MIIFLFYSFKRKAQKTIDSVGNELNCLSEEIWCLYTRLEHILARTWVNRNNSGKNAPRALPLSGSHTKCAISQIVWIGEIRAYPVTSADYFYRLQQIQKEWTDGPWWWWVFGRNSMISSNSVRKTVVTNIFANQSTIDQKTDDQNVERAKAGQLSFKMHDNRNRQSKWSPLIQNNNKTPIVQHNSPSNSHKIMKTSCMPIALTKRQSFEYCIQSKPIHTNYKQDLSAIHPAIEWKTTTTKHKYIQPK